MKKILPLLLLTLFSCEREGVSELAGTEWRYQSTKGMNEVKKQRPDGRYDIVTFQSTQFSTIMFTSDTEGIKRSWSIGGGDEYEWEYFTNFTYTYKNKKGSFELSEEGFTLLIHFSVSDDLK